MKILRFVTFLFLIYGISFYSVIGQTNNKEESDCTKFYNFIYGDTKDYGDSCCSDPGITCDNDNYIKDIHGSSLNVEIPDLKSFPYFSKIDYLNIIGKGLEEIPKDIFRLTSLKQLNLNNNSISKIPTIIKKLSQLVDLNLSNNNIQGLPNEIFMLNNLKNLDLSNNKNLKTKILNFGNSTIDHCNFDEINITCYELNACNTIQYNGITYSNADIENVVGICPSSGNSSDFDYQKRNDGIYGIVVVLTNSFLILIFLLKNKFEKNNKPDFNSDDEFRSGSIKVVFNQNQNTNNNNTNNNDSGNTNVGISINNNNSNNNNINSSNNNNNNKNNINNNNNNDISNYNVNNYSNNNINYNNNNNYNYNNNYDNAQNYLNQNYLNQNYLNQNNLNQNNNINQNIMTNSNGYNSNILPGMVVLIDNPQNPGNYVMSNVSLINNNNQINNHRSLGIPSPSLSFDKDNVIINNNNNEANIYSSSDAEGDEPPPEYVEINKSLAKQQFM